MSPTWLHPYPPSHVQPIGDQEAAFSGSKAPLGGTKRGSKKRRTRWSLLVAQYSGVQGGASTSGSTAGFGANAREMRQRMG